MDKSKSDVDGILNNTLQSARLEGGSGGIGMLGKAARDFASRLLMGRMGGRQAYAVLQLYRRYARTDDPQKKMEEGIRWLGLLSITTAGVNGRAREEVAGLLGGDGEDEGTVLGSLLQKVK